ncbi:MAG: aldehyde dehydrogenase EutE [Elusimicrobiales bacterium]|nr:aldehyde dehydrogenase EutE [Elusimicrobiales bacterium]
MSISEDDIQKIVGEVIGKLNLSEDTFEKVQTNSSMSGPVFSTVNEAVLASEKAQEIFQNLGLEIRREIIEAMRQVSLKNSERWAKMVVEDSGMGRVLDKIEKNIVSALKTPGVEDLHSKSYTGDKGLTLIEYAPFGVAAAITPSTNGVATIISNAIGLLAAGNSVVFSPHPVVKRSVQDSVTILNNAIVSAGGPENLVSTILKPTQESTKELLAHPKAALNIVTGGPAIVNVAMTVGKTCKTIAAGPGNPPIVVDETAVFPDCVSEIITGAGFDNNVLCIAEKEVIVVEKIKDVFFEAMRDDARAYELNSAQMEELTKKILTKDGAEYRVNRDFVGKNPSYIAKAIGLDLSDDIRVLWSEVSNDHPFAVTEQLMPVLPITVSKDIDSAIELAYRFEAGNHHSAGMYSTNVINMTKMGRRMACSIFVKNGCTLNGLGLGEGYCSMTIGTPTGDGITKPTHFVRPLQCSMVGSLRIA